MTSKPLGLNLRVPGDRRGWRQCKGLRDQGYDDCCYHARGSRGSATGLHDGVGSTTSEAGIVLARNGLNSMFDKETYVKATGATGQASASTGLAA